jgi:hypothetical protein
MQTFSNRWRLGLVGLLAVGLAGLSLSTARADDPPAPKPPDKLAEPPKAEPPKGDEPAKPKDGEKPAEKPKPTICEPLIATEAAKDFTLKDLDGKDRKLSEFKGKWVVLEWTNYECPYVKKHYVVTPAADGKPATPGKIPQLQKTYTDKGVIWLSICSSAPASGDKPPKEGWMSREKWKEALKERMAAPTAVLLDEDGKVGRDLYGARKTPTMWIVDPKGVVAYHGAIDDAPSPKADPLTSKNYIAEYLDAVLAGKEPPANDNKPYG